MTIVALLILHSIAAVLLLGAILHQTIAVWRTKRVPGDSFMQRLGNVQGRAYTNAIVVLYLLVGIGGGVIYPHYVLDAKGSLNDAQLLAPIGAFEIKEHFAIVGLAMLPAYWFLWRRTAPTEQVLARQLTTTLLLGLVVWNFLIGHIVNNLRGLT